MEMDRTAMWNAVVARDSAGDGKFVYAVRTTGVYCRPTCPSRRPNENNVEFFANAGKARLAGYRACARCQPDEQTNKAEDIVRRAKQFLDERIGTGNASVMLNDLGESLRMSPYHVQRVFKAHTGISPKQYMQERKMQILKEQLKRGAAVTEAVYEAGFGSASRVYEQSTRELGMTPAAYARGGRGEVIVYAVAETALGMMLIGVTERGVCALMFADGEEQLVEDLHAQFALAKVIRADAHDERLERWVAAVESYLEGNAIALASVEIAYEGTALQQAVWRYLRTIPFGETRTYTQVAAQVGKPNAVRAVASACASNKIALAVPCHRVLRTDGSLGGYRWGLQRKAELLRREREAGE